MLSMMKRIFDEGSREVHKLTKHVDKINALEEEISRLSDEDLKSSTAHFKQKLQEGKTLDDIKEVAFAVVREAAKRVLNQRHYDVQLIGGLVLHNGDIAEMQTGEGKTLVATLPSYLHALEGKGVHIITANEYLAKRDFETMGKIHNFLGLTVGLTISQLSHDEKKQAYNADITYGTGTEFGFDYLRDNMVHNLEEKVQRPLHFAIVDEIDSILIDEARTPLIIANKSALSTELFYVTAEIVKSFEKDVEYEFFPETKQIVLAEAGAKAVENAFGIENLYDAEHRELLHHLMQSLRASVVMRKDVDYIVRGNDIVLVDQFTGRIMEGRTFSEGLHQALEAKEGVIVKEENDTQATITVQNYFRMYTTLCGMTGSATPAKREFLDTYGNTVVSIPTNKPRIRIDMQDIVYKKKDDKIKRIVEEVAKHHSNQRPVLIGTTSIEQSENLSAYLTKANIKHQILNAKTVEDEAKLIATAGQKGQVMLATNMAGRGTDILLGEGVAELGGLHIIGTEKHESARIDMQLRGRGGRQGDPGSTQFIISLEDDLFNAYDTEELDRWKKKLKTNTDGLVISPDPVKFVKKVQETVEGAHFSARSHLLKLDDVVDDQRKIVYKKRNGLLAKQNVMSDILESIRNHSQQLIKKYCIEEDVLIEEWNIAGLYEELSLIYNNLGFTQADITDVEKEVIEKYVSEAYENYRNELVSLEKDFDFQSQVKSMMLQELDSKWVQHIDIMTNLKEGISMRSYGQEDPYRLYEFDAFEEFIYLLRNLDATISRQFLAYVKNHEIQMQQREEETNNE
ncbi:accessory Sec system translocase SecA2 [Cytobacillus suaedae]|nr:accessory Sec system translocase SecA2 [Cytobacillus suaedae]